MADDVDFVALILKAREFRARYQMANVIRPMARRVCLDLARILERRHELLDAVTDAKPGPELARLATEWADKLRDGSAACLEVLRAAREGESFPERRVAQWLRMGFLAGGEPGQGESQAEGDKYFERVFRNLRPELERLQDAAARLKYMADVVVAVQGIDDEWLYTGPEALPPLADEILALAYEALRFNRRSPTLPHELAAFLGDVFRLAGVLVSEERLLAEARRFCREKLGKAV